MLEYGRFAGRRYSLELKVCPNPCCPCQEVELRCAPENQTEPAGPVASVGLRMDFRKRKIALIGQEGGDSARELGRAFVEEIAPVHWQLLGERFLAVKRRITQEEDLTGFTPQFPPEVLANSGPMVSYHGILPFAERLEVASEGRSWALDEQYCLHDPCSCHGSALTFIRLEESPPTRKRKPFTISVRYNYATGVFERESPASPRNPLPDMLCSALRDKYPDLNSILAQRQRKLMRLLKKVKGRVMPAPAPPPVFVTPEPMPEIGSIPRPAARSEKPGRNDPCPCGSGKKYKKCCGR